MIEDVFGLLCEANLATISEILDPSGPWSLDLMAFMAPVAIKISTRRKGDFFRAVVAGVSGLFKGGEEIAKGYAAELSGALKAADKMQGGPEKAPEDLQAKAADDLLALMDKIPMRKKGR